MLLDEFKIIFLYKINYIIIIIIKNIFLLQIYF